MQKERVVIALLLHMGGGAISQILSPLESIGTIQLFSIFFIIFVGFGVKRWNFVHTCAPAQLPLIGATKSSSNTHTHTITMGSG